MERPIDETINMLIIIENSTKSLKTAIDIIHKYQKIEQILNDWENSGEEDDPINIIDNIEEVIEDENDD